MNPQIKQAKLETLEAIIKEVEGIRSHGMPFGDMDLINRNDLLTKLEAEKELIEREI